jgi:hypothetical protein
MVEKIPLLTGDVTAVIYSSLLQMEVQESVIAFTGFFSSHEFPLPLTCAGRFPPLGMKPVFTRF